MENEAEIIRLLQRYSLAYPNSTMDAATFAFYARALNRFTVDDLEAAMMKLIQTCKFFPSIAEIAESAQSFIDYVENLRPTAAEAWREAMRQARINFLHRPWEYSCEEVKATVEAFGKRELCMLEESAMNTARAQFMRMYNEIVERAKEEREIKEIRAVLDNDRAKLARGKIIELAEARRA